MCMCVRCVCELLCVSMWFSCPQAIGYGLVLLDGNDVNINKLKKLNLSRIDRLFKVINSFVE